MNKQTIVMDTYTHARKGKYMKSEPRKTKSSGEETDPEILLLQQRIKEKQLLLKWKAAQKNEKKYRSIRRGYSRDYHAEQKEYFMTMDDGCAFEDETQYLWKNHVGCIDECRSDNCIWWKLESGLMC